MIKKLEQQNNTVNKSLATTQNSSNIELKEKASQTEETKKKVEKMKTDFAKDIKKDDISRKLVTTKKDTYANMQRTKNVQNEIEGSEEVNTNAENMTKDTATERKKKITQNEIQQLQKKLQETLKELHWMQQEKCNCSRFYYMCANCGEKEEDHLQLRRYRGKKNRYVNFYCHDRETIYKESENCRKCRHSKGHHSYRCTGK